METIESLRRKIKSAEDLHGVVKTMKALAAVSIRQYERALESLGEYGRSVEMGFQVLLKNRPDDQFTQTGITDGNTGAVIFGSDQGMVGQFNEVVAQHALGELEAGRIGNGRCSVLAVGLRVFSRLEEAGQSVENLVSLPGSVSTITEAVQDMVMRLEAWQAKKNIGRIVLFYNQPVSGAAYAPQTVHLLPVDSQWFYSLREKNWPSRSLPQFTINWDSLFSSLIREYLFISLYQAFAKSLASENASRLTAMQVAERNIEERLQALHGKYHQLRQTTIDAELFDLVAGFEAMTQ